MNEPVLIPLTRGVGMSRRSRMSSICLVPLRGVHDKVKRIAPRERNSIYRLHARISGLYVVRFTAHGKHYDLGEFNDWRTAVRAVEVALARDLPVTRCIGCGDAFRSLRPRTLWCNGECKRRTNKLSLAYAKLVLTNPVRGFGVRCRHIPDKLARQYRDYLVAKRRILNARKNQKGNATDRGSRKNR